MCMLYVSRKLSSHTLVIKPYFAFGSISLFSAFIVAAIFCEWVPQCFCWEMIPCPWSIGQLSIFPWAFVPTYLCSMILTHQNSRNKSVTCDCRISFADNVTKSSRREVPFVRVWEIWRLWNAQRYIKSNDAKQNWISIWHDTRRIMGKLIYNQRWKSIMRNGINFIVDTITLRPSRSDFSFRSWSTSSRHTHCYPARSDTNFHRFYFLFFGKFRWHFDR